MTKILDSITTLGASASVILIIENITTILTAIAALIAIITGIISIVLKIKSFVSDGKITDEEMAEIDKDVENLTGKINNIKK